MTVDTGELAADRVRLRTLRRSLGLRLVTYRNAAGVSQPELAQALGRTRTTISKVEHGTRGMPEKQWKLTDEVCRADGALIAEHSVLAQAEQDYRGRWRTQQRQARQAAAQAGADALRASPGLVPAARERGQAGRRGARPETIGVGSELAEELIREVITTLARSLGRREALRAARWALAAMSLAGLDTDECTRVARALDAPHRVDPHVVNNLATTLAHCKRQEDTLGPCEVLDTVVAQHGIVRRLLKGDCSEGLRRSLKTVDSDMAATIGGYLMDMGHPDGAARYFDRARRAGHDARNPACAAYAACWASFAAFDRGDTPAALDAAAARSLAARTDDVRLKALAELRAAEAYALDGQFGPCMAACARAQEFLASATAGAPESLAYWVNEGTLDKLRSKFLSLLGKPRQAVEAATNALARYDHTPYVRHRAFCEVRLGNGLVLSKEIPEAARVLGEMARFASLSPRLTAELRAVRALMQPWEGTQAVTTLDSQLEAYGLMPTAAPLWRPGSSGPSS
ncbi:MAG: helix-turn-helix domain-containing protein [Pseudonocardiaceae bacterium]